MFEFERLSACTPNCCLAWRAASLVAASFIFASTSEPTPVVSESPGLETYVRLVVRFSVGAPSVLAAVGIEPMAVSTPVSMLARPAGTCFSTWFKFCSDCVRAVSAVIADGLVGRPGPESWRGEFEQGDQGSFCLTAARMAADQERVDAETSTPEPPPGIQGALSTGSGAALAALKGEKTVAELARQFAVHANQITPLRQAQEEGAASGRGCRDIWV